MNLNLIWAACVAVTGVLGPTTVNASTSTSEPTLTSDAAWTRFRTSREAADDGREFTAFNRFVFGTYQNLAIFTGPWARTGDFLEQFLTEFPNTRVHAGAAVLKDLDAVAARLDPAELSLIVIDERFLDHGNALAAALARVDQMNADGYVVKIVVIVQDEEVVLPTTAAWRGQFFDFGSNLERKLKAAVENFGTRPDRSRSWINLIGQFQGRDRLVMLRLVQMFLSDRNHLGVLAGNDADTNRLLDNLGDRVSGVHVLRRDRTALVNLAPPTGYRKIGLNVIRLPVEVDARGQWPPKHEFFRLVHEVNMANARGTRVKLLIESTAPFEVPPAVGERTVVIASTHGCESYLKSVRP